MLERLKVGFSRIKERLTSNIVFVNVPERGVEVEFVFGGEYSPEEWEEALTDLYENSTPEKLEAFEQIIQEANEKTPEERAKYVEDLMAPTKVLVVSKNAKEEHKSLLAFEQFLININSMSETNLTNLQKGIYLKKSR